MIWLSLNLHLVLSYGGGGGAGSGQQQQQQRQPFLQQQQQPGVTNEDENFDRLTHPSEAPFVVLPSNPDAISASRRASVGVNLDGDDASHESDAASRRWRSMYANDWSERVSVTEQKQEPGSPRVPRRISPASGSPNLDFFTASEGSSSNNNDGGSSSGLGNISFVGLSGGGGNLAVVLPREINVDPLPSTPHLNAIMGRALTKVKGMLDDLEKAKGRTSIVMNELQDPAKSPL